MRDEWLLAISSLVDGEAVGDEVVLAEALSAPEGREALLDFVHLRAAVRGDESKPGPAFYEKVRPAVGVARAWPASRALRRIAAAIVFVLGTAGLVDLGLRLRGDKAAEQPPRATRVLRFERGIDWHVNAR